MQTYTVIPEKMVIGGECMTKINGKAVFIPYAIPGEKIEIRITADARDYDKAEIVSILDPSPFRTEPVCPHYGKCGGCNMQHITAEHQRILRASVLKDCFEREGIQPPEIEIISGSELNYRARIQLTDGGFSEKKSNNIIPVNNCPVATQEINSYLERTSVKERPEGRVHFFGDSRIIPDSIADNKFQEKLMIADETKNLRAGQSEQKLLKNGKKLKNKVKPRFAGTSADTRNICEVELCSHKIRFDVKGFFQSNLEVLEKTIEILKAETHGKNLLDMYSGAGTFSAVLSDNFEQTTLVEHNRDALVCAEINLAGKKHQSYGLSGKNWVETNASIILNKDGAFDAVIIDPPRSGMEKEVCAWLCRNKTKHLRSVSCDPATHARDCARLIKSGYQLTRLFLLDFYPQTAHIESLAFFDS